MQDNFGTARFVAMIAEIAGWALIVLAAVYVIANRGDRDFDLIVMVGAGGAVAGLLLVAAAQVMKAQIVTAESTSASQALLEKLVKQMAPGIASRPNAVASLALPSASAPRSAHDADGLVETAHGHDIYRRGDKFYMDGAMYHTLTQAVNYARRYPIVTNSHSDPGNDEFVRNSYGHDIYRRGGKFIVDGREFITVDGAENYAKLNPASRSS